MSSTDDEEETGCTMVYHCSKCDEAKPRKDFHNMYDRINIANIFYKTCKECRDKVKATKELRKEQKKRIQPIVFTILTTCKILYVAIVVYISMKSI